MRVSQKASTLYKKFNNRSKEENTNNITENQTQSTSTVTKETTTGQSTLEDEELCCICMEKLDPTVFICTECLVAMHVHCTVKAAAMKANCPYCRDEKFYCGYFFKDINSLRLDEGVQIQREKWFLGVKPSELRIFLDEEKSKRHFFTRNRLITATAMKETADQVNFVTENVENSRVDIEGLQRIGGSVSIGSWRPVGNVTTHWRTWRNAHRVRYQLRGTWYRLEDDRRPDREQQRSRREDRQ